eukprot:Rhum_TRINITY_DN14689_c22_g1::Rhum_TRINITY_DN14689_c22_g1_i1::g.109900::m.109900
MPQSFPPPFLPSPLALLNCPFFPPPPPFLLCLIELLGRRTVKRRRARSLLLRRGRHGLRPDAARRVRRRRGTLVLILVSTAAAAARTVSPHQVAVVVLIIVVIVGRRAVRRCAQRRRGERPGGPVQLGPGVHEEAARRLRRRRRRELEHLILGEVLLDHAQAQRRHRGARPARRLTGVLPPGGGALRDEDGEPAVASERLRVEHVARGVGVEACRDDGPLRQRLVRGPDLEEAEHARRQPVQLVRPVAPTARLRLARREAARPPRRRLAVDEEGAHGAALLALATLARRVAGAADGGGAAAQRAAGALAVAVAALAAGAAAGAAVGHVVGGAGTALAQRHLHGVPDGPRCTHGADDGDGAFADDLAVDAEHGHSFADACSRSRGAVINLADCVSLHSRTKGFLLGLLRQRHGEDVRLAAGAARHS